MSTSQLSPVKSNHEIMTEKQATIDQWAPEIGRVRNLDILAVNGPHITNDESSGPSDPASTDLFLHCTPKPASESAMLQPSSLFAQAEGRNGTRMS